MKPWSQLSGEWKRVRTSGIVTQIDRLARHHHTSAVTIAANIMKRKAGVLKLTDIHTIAKKIERGVPLDRDAKSGRSSRYMCYFFPAGANFCKLVCFLQLFDLSAPSLWNLHFQFMP